MLIIGEAMADAGIKFLGSLNKNPINRPVENNKNGSSRNKLGHHPSFRAPSKAVTVAERVGRLAESWQKSGKIFNGNGDGIEMDRVPSEAFHNILMNHAESMLVQGAPEPVIAEELLEDY